MAKSLCKYRRVEIADQFDKISRLVSEPRFICSSCARSASDKAYLCKPSALTLRPVATSPVEAKAPAKGRVLAEGAPDPQAVIGYEEAEAVLATVKKKQAKQLKKLAKKKNKRLKKAAKAVHRYEKALVKTNKAQRCQPE